MNFNINKEEYEKDLAERQRRHLENLNLGQLGTTAPTPWQPCMHDACSGCLGTGIRFGGGICIHMISCPCPKCTPSYFVNFQG